VCGVVERRYHPFDGVIRGIGKLVELASPPQAVIIAGPNGSGKSTAATKLLPPDMTFINADLIAQELTGDTGTAGDINAGRILVARAHVLEKLGEPFAFETTLATRMMANRVRRWKVDGYQVHLIYFWLPSPELSIWRVRYRVRDGGHFVPDDTVRRRYDAGLRNLFEIYMPLVHTWRIYDNSTLEPHLVAKGGEGRENKVYDAATWSAIMERRNAIDAG